MSAIVLFDGVCNLCSGSVQFIIRRDPKARFRFAAMQSEIGRALMVQCRMPLEPIESFVLIEGAECLIKSDAAIHIARRLSGLWPLLSALAVIPRPLRDLGYDVIARHRYAWFGKKSACMVPSAKDRERFLDTLPKKPLA